MLGGLDGLRRQNGITYMNAIVEPLSPVPTRFVEAAVPAIVRDEKIIISAPTPPRRLELTDALMVFLSDIFATSITPNVNVQIGVWFEHTGGEMLRVPIRLPVELIRGLDVAVTGWAAPGTTTLADLSALLGDSLSTWYEANAPSKTDGAFAFDLTVMTELGGTSPLLTLSNLVLPLAP